MKKVVYTKYGSPDVFEIVEVKKPVPKENEILIKIFAGTVTATEATFRKGKPFVARLFTGVTKPKIKTLGEELSGDVVAVGRNVKLFNEGESIFGTAGPDFGANAEYISIPEDGVITTKPNNCSYDEAASAIDGFLTALPFLRVKGNIESGQKVLVNGASGSVGSSAVQIAKYYGAEVTGVCSASNAELVKSIGADKVIDYRKEDFTKNGETYNIIFDAVAQTSFRRCKKSLTANGIFLEVGITLGVFPSLILTKMFGRKKAKIMATGLRPPGERKKDLIFLKELMESEKIKPVIDRAYALEQISEAHSYVDKGHKRGNVVLRIGNID